MGCPYPGLSRDATLPRRCANLSGGTCSSSTGLRASRETTGSLEMQPLDVHLGRVASRDGQGPSRDGPTPSLGISGWVRPSQDGSGYLGRACISTGISGWWYLRMIGDHLGMDRPQASASRDGSGPSREAPRHLEMGGHLGMVASRDGKSRLLGTSCSPEITFSSRDTPNVCVTFTFNQVSVSGSESTVYAWAHVSDL